MSRRPKRIVLIPSLVVLAAGALAAGALADWLVGRPFSQALVLPPPPSVLGSANEGRPLDEGIDSDRITDAPDGGPSESVTDAAATVGTAYAELVTRRVEGHDTPALFATDNYLLVGIDRRRGSSSRGRADSLLVVILDPESGHVGVVSVPRDVYVDVPGQGPARINATLPMARRAGVDGLNLLRELVEDLLDLRIQHAIAVDLSTFERIVDLLGGVDVDVPCALRDNFIDPAEDGGRRALEVPKGRVHMDGVTAGMYARSRHGRSDWSRARRQQAILMGIKDRMSGISGVLRLPALLDELEGSVQTDLSRLDLLRLGRRALRIRSEHIHGVILGYRQMEHHRTELGQSVLLPRYAAIDATLARLFEAQSPGVLPVRGQCRPADAALR